MGAWNNLYFRTGSQQIVASLQDFFPLAVMLWRFDEGINAQFRDTYENHPEYQVWTDIYMAYLNEHIEACRLKCDDIMLEATDAAGESTKIPRLQQALQEFDENFDVIGLVSFNWGHAKTKALSIEDRYVRERSIAKDKCALRYLAGQEHMCRMSGMAQRITPQLLNLHLVPRAS